MYQRKDGRWVGAISVPGGRRKYYYGGSRKEVANALKRALRDQQLGATLPNEKDNQLSPPSSINGWS